MNTLVRQVRSLAGRILLLLAVMELAACEKPASADAKQDSADRKSMKSLPANTNKSPLPKNQKGASATPVAVSRTVLSAPPEIVVPLDILESKYQWNGEQQINKLSENATVVRMRKGEGAVWSVQGAAIGNLVVDGEFYFDDEAFHLVQGKACVDTALNKAEPDNPEVANETKMEIADGVRMAFIKLPAGSFIMGPDFLAKDATATHEVVLTKSFYLGKYEVTQEQWRSVMGENPSHFKGAKRPVENVTWSDCQTFISKIQPRMKGLTARLPTEAEWEYACRAGTKGDYCFGEDPQMLADYAWYTENSERTTHPVGKKKPNAWGFYDMHGNVWEWCGDWCAQYPMGMTTDPQGAATGAARVVRGGCWAIEREASRSAYRYLSPPDGKSFGLGFRLVLQE